MCGPSRTKGINMEHLLQHCQTQAQTKIIEAIIKCGSQPKAAKYLGINPRTVTRTLARIRKNVNMNDCRDGFSVTKVSTLYGPDGETKIEWVQIKPGEEERHEQLIESVTAAFEDYTGTAKLIKPLKNYNKDLLNLIPMGDPHIGMYAWADECGEDFDCDIAERDIITAVQQLFASAPMADTCILLNLGDFFHSDHSGNTTMKSGHSLDVDGRWGRVLQIGVRIMITCIELALQKHKKVIVKNVIGNHDDHTSQMLAVALSCFFSKNKRVDIDTSASKFWYYRFGKCLFGSTHGDTTKPANLPLIMASDRSEDWGQTEYRYFHTGHIHHSNVTEFVGCTWESHRTLAAKDAWHAAQGYRSQRDMKRITYHKHYGEDSRHTMSIARVRK